MTTKKILIHSTRLVLVSVVTFMFVWLCFGEALVYAGTDPDNAKNQQAASTAKSGSTDRDDEQNVLHLNTDILADLKLTTVPVRRGTLSLTLELPGEVNWASDRVAHVVPRVPGIVKTVKKTLGDVVQESELLAELDSSELTSLRADYLAALSRKELAQANFDREKQLWKQKITPEQEYLKAKNTLVESQIAMKLAHLRLHAVGVPDATVRALPRASDSELSIYRLKAPIAGVIVERHIVRGEKLNEESEVFLIADPSRVWVLGSVYEKDIAHIKLGQKASIRLNAYPDRLFSGNITWISDAIDEQTRTLKVRMEVANPDRLLKSKMFARISLAIVTKAKALIIPASALQRQKGKIITFVDQGNGRFERRELKVGIQSDKSVEILSGVREGERVVTDGGFILKSELEKESFEAD